MRGSHFLAACMITCSVALTASPGRATTLAGLVIDANEAPVRAAFVQARNQTTKVTISVLSDRDGRYAIKQLPQGEYQLNVSKRGMEVEPSASLRVEPGIAVRHDFKVHRRPVSWSEVSMYEGKVLLPDGPGKADLFNGCVGCHGFQSRVAAHRFPREAWEALVDSMRGYHYFLGSNFGQFGEQTYADVTTYLTTHFGPEPSLPSPDEMPGYADLVRPISDDVLNIVYVDYELPGPDRFAWSAYPDGKGSLWIPYMGRSNRAAKLDPVTATFYEIVVPEPGVANIHSIVSAPDGTVWMAVQRTNKLAKYDPHTQQVSLFQASNRHTERGTMLGGSKSTVRIDDAGNVWCSGGPLVRFDPGSERFTEFWDEAPFTYSIAIDTAGNIWFTELTRDQLGRYDTKTGRFSYWDVPSPPFPRRIFIDPDGLTVWFAEYERGKIARFDPTTETFEEWPLPGPRPTPYAFGMDARGYLWYSSYEQDVYGRLDPRTGSVIEYPFPYPENASREFFLDADDRMWFATPPNNRVGYFYLDRPEPSDPIAQD